MPCYVPTERLQEQEDPEAHLWSRGQGADSSSAAELETTAVEEQLEPAAEEEQAQRFAENEAREEGLP